MNKNRSTKSLATMCKELTYDAVLCNLLWPCYAILFLVTVMNRSSEDIFLPFHCPYIESISLVLERLEKKMCNGLTDEFVY